MVYKRLNDFPLYCLQKVIKFVKNRYYAYNDKGV